MAIIEKIKSYLKNRTRLDTFLIKAGGLVIVYYLIRIIIKFTPFIKPVFVFGKNTMKSLLVYSTDFLLNILGYDSNVYKNIVWITGSEGVKVINACLGWSVMALFIGFILIYPAVKKPKYWYIPSGLLAIILMNILRITGMALISYHNYDALQFYHRYIFNFSLYVVVFILWIVWVNKFGIKQAN